MASSYMSIYNLAITRFDDPILSKLYLENSQDFFETMNKKMSLAIAEFTMPASAVVKLADRIEPIFYKEVFNGDDIKKEFTLTEITLSEDALVEARVNGILVNIDTIVGNVITLENIPQEGVENVEISAYIDGSFNQTLTDREKNILSLWIVKVWAEREKNFLLDIRRLIGDKDFKIISESNSLREKSNWYTSIREEASKKMNSLSWSTSVNNRRSR
jgi:hypothetical protein